MQAINQGKEFRSQVGRKSQGIFTLNSNRPPVVEMIKAGDHDRLPELLPIRYQRMGASPFAFYRGTAGIMAYDLSFLPRTDIKVQAIGDCHLMNFGGFATPERTLVFDANDFDETLPASWEWDVKRLATSFVLAARHNHCKEYTAKEIAFIFAQSYRRHMIEFSKISALELWYTKFDVESIFQKSKSNEFRQMLSDVIDRSKKQTSGKILYKITKKVSGNFEITDQPPLIYHSADVHDKDAMRLFIENYSKTLSDDRRWLLEQFQLVDIALKVTGVGSVGTRCYVALLMNKSQEPLFLQIKEATASVLEKYTAKSIYSHSGQRVVEGQRLVQAASDIFLGWGTGADGRQYYFRQLRDKKIAPLVEEFDPELLTAYARLCGRMLARAHAKTGNAAQIAGYMGKSEMMDDAFSDFAVAYADQTEKDFSEFKKSMSQ
ncbi:MAG: DUF2252 domain-containing protein [Bacteroidetes bacterium]|nr:DUF2252 domain-containing protein [Bacteroidota bacterium]